MRHIGIIGAGVAGLTVAFRRQALGDRVSVFEAAPRVGGQLHSERADGFIVEHGAEGFVAGSQALADLAGALGIEGRLLDQQVTESCTFDGERLLRLAPGEAGRLLGFQVAERAFGRGIQSFAGGMLELAEVLRARLGSNARCELAAPIAAIEPLGARWVVVPAAGAPLQVDQLVIATPARAAAALLEPIAGSLGAALATSAALSSVSVSIAYPRDAVAHALDATGFVVAEAAQAEGFRACTFASSKLRGRAPGDRSLLRAFFRPTEAELEAFDDAAWTERAVRCLGRALELRGAHERAWVSRWPRALPVFDAAHRERVERLEERLRGTGIFLAGAGFHGSGIDGAVRSAEAAARALSSAVTP